MANRKKTILDWALEYHSAGINIVKVIYKGKFPASGKKWEKYQAERVTIEQLEKWFSSDASYGNISAVTGPISGGLTAVDFDADDIYKRWSAKHPELAELPTTRSGRGYHVFCGSGLNKDDTSTFTGIDIKAKGLISLPPSMHKSDKRYEWIIPLPDNVSDLPLHTPYEWNLVEFTDGNDGSDGSEGIDGNEGVGRNGLNTLEQLKPESRRMVLEAIDSTLPKGYGQRYCLLFLFARKLKKIDEIKNLSAEEIMFIADMWHKRALPNIEHKSLIMTQERFKNAWQDAKYPPGEGMSLEIAKKAAFNSTKPMPELEPYAGEELYQKVIRVCFELQRLAGPDDVWFIPTNKAQELFGVSHSWLSTLLKSLDGKVIKKTQNFTARRCNRYIFIGPSIAKLRKKPA